MKALVPLFLVASMFACGKDKDKKEEVSEVLSQNACLKAGEYCYVPKQSFGFVETSCKDAGGTIVLACDANPVLSCETDSMSIKLYGEQAKAMTCADVGQKIPE